MNWCKVNVGLNYRRHTLPELEWHSTGEDCGDYDFDDNIITIILNKEVFSHIKDLLNCFEWY